MPLLLNGSPVAVIRSVCCSSLPRFRLSRRVSGTRDSAVCCLPILLVFLMCELVATKSLSRDGEASVSGWNLSAPVAFRGEDPTSYAPVLKLYNRCSKGFVQTYYDVVDANGKGDSPLVQLRVQTEGFGSRIRIQSQKFGKYLCLNRRKRLITRYNGRSSRCVFVERIGREQYTELESAWRPGTFIGFKRNGRSLKASKYSVKPKCFQFLKVGALGSNLQDREQRFWHRTLKEIFVKSVKARRPEDERSQESPPPRLRHRSPHRRHRHRHDRRRSRRLLLRLDLYDS